MTLNRTKAIAWVAPLAVMGVFSIAGCSSGSTSSSTPSPTEPTAYSQQITETYVNTCTQTFVKQGMTEAVAKANCECDMRGFQKEISFDQFLAADKAAGEGAKLPEAFTKIIQACAKNQSAY